MFTNVSFISTTIMKTLKIVQVVYSVNLQRTIIPFCYP